ncbi:MAG: porin [Kiloniellales bacterium]
MKKVLYGTTALCAAGMLGATGAAADGIELGIGGYMNTLFSAGGINATAGRDSYAGTPAAAADYNPTGLWADGEVWFLGSYKHDNGIRFGARVELEVFASSTSSDTIDEHYIFVDGDFGRVVAGSENSAAYIMHYAAPVSGLPINSGWVTVFIPPNADSSVGFRQPSVSTYLDYGNDENQLTYYTPRFSGFQLGLSYAPTVDGSGEGKNFPVEADNNTEYNNGFAVGANFVDDFDGIGVAISVGYTRAQAPDNLTSLSGVDDYQGFNVGANFSYAGVTIGGAYANAFDGQVRTFTDGNGVTQVSSAEGQSFDVGIAYSAGPWTVGAEYFQGEVDGIVSNGTTGAAGSGIVGAGNEDKLYAATGGLTYALGPGITARGGVMYGRWSAESGAVNTGVIGAAGLSFRF